MQRSVRFVAVMVAALALSGTAQAQSWLGIPQSQTTPQQQPSLGSVIGEHLTNKAVGLVEKSLPDVSSASAANASGLLSYCITRHYLKGSTASSLLDTLTGREEIRGSNAFRLGQQGSFEAANGTLFSLDSLQDAVKGKLCDLVLERAQSLF